MALVNKETWALLGVLL